MRRFFTIAVAVLLLVVVMAVFFSPAVDLQPTALRIILWIAALFASFALVTVKPSARRSTLSRPPTPTGPPAAPPALLHPLALLCAWIC